MEIYFLKRNKMRHLILCFAIVLLCSCKTTQPEIIAPVVPAPVEQKTAQSNTPNSTSTKKIINKKTLEKREKTNYKTDKMRTYQIYQSKDYA